LIDNTVFIKGSNLKNCRKVISAKHDKDNDD